jgi:type III secretion protein N (ATPase)
MSATETLLADMGALQDRLLSRAARQVPMQVNGRITRITGTVLHAILSEGRIGEEVILRDPIKCSEMLAEIIGFHGDEALLAPCGAIDGLSSRAEVVATGQHPRAPLGSSALGRVIDAFGNPLDDGGAIPPGRPLDCDPPQPMSRPVIDTAFQTGLRAIDGMLTMGVGQRVGLFGAAGVGKSTLLSQIIRGSNADRIVLGLIGERGREVAEFLERDLGPDGRKRAAVVVATSDRPATERLRAAMTATAIAEGYRDEGHSTLLLVDSATRIARALREIGLSAGEPPVRRGFPPSVFARLPRLVERAGRNGAGSITAIYTILVEGDDDNADPVADELRSLLDGHIVLSRELAQQGHFPAIDVLRSKSRVMEAVTDEAHQRAARRLARFAAKLNDVELLVQVGEYQAGGDPLADAALAAKPAMEAFLRQGAADFSELSATIEQLRDATQGSAP